MLIYLQLIEDHEEKCKFERLYHKYHRLMYAVAKSILKSDQDAEDAVHQAFLYIAENLGRVRDIDSSETKVYLIVITEHKAIDILRDNARLAPAQIEEEIAGVSFAPPSESALDGALAGLPARYREAILLRYAYGYSTKELAKLYKTSPGNVQRLLWRAKKALQEKLEETGDWV